MIKKTIIVIFLISAIFINSPQLFADSSMYNSDDFGNIMGYVTDVGATSGSIYDLSMTSPQDDWYNRNIAAPGYGTPRVVVCNDIKKTCNEVRGDVQIPTSYIPKNKKPAPNTTPVNYFTQDCIDKGFITVSNYPFTYKCSEDKTAYYVCYKNQRLGYYIEPNPYPFTKPLETNRLRKAICDLTPVTSVQEPHTETQVDQPTTDNSEAITDASLFLSLIPKIEFVGFDSLRTNFSNSNVPKTNLRVPYFIINYGTDDIYRANDINVTVHLDENGFNFNEEIYMLIANEENYNNIISEINNFVSTINSEYTNKTSSEIDNPPYFNINCNCKYRRTADSEIKYYPLPIVFAHLNLINGKLDDASKKKVNDSCTNTCEVNQKMVRKNAPGLYEYDLGDYELSWPETRETIINYNLITYQEMDKIKFKLNSNSVQFTIGKNNLNKKFVVVFMQKTDKKLNISYSNFYVLNNDEILSYSLCEANRVILSHFCDSSLNPECKIVKSCYNGYDLNYDSIDLTEFIYSTASENLVTSHTDTPPESTPPVDTPPADTQNYYSTRNNTRDACSNANITVNQWACVCIIQNSGAKRVVPAKCSSINGLVLYGAPDRGKVPTANQFCYNEPSTKCR
jgi:hypothetical protein